MHYLTASLLKTIWLILLENIVIVYFEKGNSISIFCRKIGELFSVNVGDSCSNQYALKR
jgi:hypothetical protein